jgi:hypothetical protein
MSPISNLLRCLSESVTKGMLDSFVNTPKCAPELALNSVRFKPIECTLISHLNFSASSSTPSPGIGEKLTFVLLGEAITQGDSKAELAR